MIFFFAQYYAGSFFYVFNGSDDFPTTINMWLSLLSLFTHSSTVVLSLAPIPFARNDNRNDAVRDAQTAMPLILFFNEYLFLNH
jgi:hypothetical protein